MTADGQSRAQPALPPLPERYRVRRHLASGGMASVWCAEDVALARTVAIKVLAERFADDEMALRRFKREARAAARVSTHPHVVTIYDVGELAEGSPDGRPGRAFIVMEHLAGGTVADAIRHGAVRRQEAIRWLREASSALDHAHARGIVHRDIKPANFLLDRSRVLHVADFGIARLAHEDTITTAGELFGTAAYLSPEQALGREATSAADRYALAVVAFELLAGTRPFDAPHFAAQARQHIEAPPPRISDRDRTLPAGLDPVLQRALAKAPQERFETAAAFMDALETALSGGVAVIDGPLAPPPPASGRGPSRRARPRREVPRKSSAQHRPRPLPAPSPAPATASTSAARTWSPAASLEPVAAGRRGRTGVVALGLMLALLAGAAVAAVTALQGSGGRPPVTASSHSVVALARLRAARRRSAPQARPRPETRTSVSAPAASDPDPNRDGSDPGVTGAQSGGPESATAAAQLQLTGHQEMLAGDYPVAIATLHQAISAASPTSLTYAYGLYDLGRALLLSGDPAGAVPILEQRIKIPNQTSIVRQTLNQALQESGQPVPSLSASSGTGSSTGSATQTTQTTQSAPSPSPAHGGAPAPGPPVHHGRGHHHRPGPSGGQAPGGSGGAGLGAPGQEEHTSFVA